MRFGGEIAKLKCGLFNFWVPTDRRKSRTGLNTGLSTLSYKAESTGCEVSKDDWVQDWLGASKF